VRIRELSIKQWLIVVGAAFVLLLVAARLHLKWKVHRAVAELRENGKAVSKADLYKKYPRIPDEENAAVLLAEAHAKLPFPTENELDHLPVVGNYTELKADGGRWPAEVLAAVEQCLDQRKDGMELALRGAQLPKYWVDRSEGKPGDSRSTLMDAHFIVSMLSLRARYGIQTEKWDAIPQLIEAQIRIGNHMVSEPSLIGRLVCMAYYSLALFDLERYLNASGLEAGDLSGISAALKQATDDWPLDRTVEWERVEALEPIYWKSEPMILRNEFEAIYSGNKRDEWETSLDQIKVILYRFSGLADLDLLYMLEAFGRMENASLESLRSISDLSASWNSIEPGATGHRFYLWSERMLPVYRRPLGKWVETHAKLRAATAAVAVTRYRIDHDGRLPGSLEELVPEYLDEVPLEPRSEKPFELIKTGHEFGIGRGAPVFSVVNSDP
jgi:hypothetical protein